MNSYCIVFGTQSLVNALAAGSTPEDVAAAACHSVAEQVFEQQLQEIDIKTPVIMVGGTSLIEGLVKAMGDLLQVEIVVPHHSQYIGAVGSLWPRKVSSRIMTWMPLNISSGMSGRPVATITTVSQMSCSRS
jgi:activator of 2-hydroxyglutaryl-CoA dehydratase